MAADLFSYFLTLQPLTSEQARELATRKAERAMARNLAGEPAQDPTPESQDAARAVLAEQRAFAGERHCHEAGGVPFLPGDFDAWRLQ